MKKPKRIRAFMLALLLVLAPLTVGASTAMRGQILKFGSPVVVEADETVAGDVVSFFGSVRVMGRIEGDLVGVFSPVEVFGGEVKGDTVALFAPLTLRGATLRRDAVSVFGGVSADKETHIRGNAVGVMGAGLDVRQAQVQGDRIDVAGFLPGNISGLALLGMLIAILAALKQILAFVVGVLAIVIFPERFEQMSDHVFQDMGKKTLVGFLVTIGGFALILILAVTVVGVPLIPLVIPALLLLEFAGNTTMKIAFGRRISQGLGHQWGAILELFVGTLIYLLLEITLVGKLFTFIFKLIGTGQVVDSRFGDRLPEGSRGGLPDAN